MIKIKKLIVFIFALILVFSFGISSFAAVTADQQANSLYSGWGTGTTVTYASGYGTSWYYRVIYWLSQLKTEVTSIKTDVSSMKSTLSTLSTTCSNIKTESSSLDDHLTLLLTNFNSYVGSSGYPSLIYNRLSTINENLLSILNKIPSSVSSSGGSSSDLSNIESALGTKTLTNNSIIYSLNSLAADISRTSGEFYYYDRNTKEFSASADYFFSTATNLFNISGAVDMLQRVLADENDLAIKQDSENNTQAVNDNFLSSSGTNSVKTEDIGNLSFVSSSVKDTFSTGTSPTGVFDVVNSDNPWEWFTDDVANSLLADGGSSSSTFSLRFSPADNDTVVTSYYQDNLSDLFSWLKKVG